jgi:hypothetical protein
MVESMIADPLLELAEYEAAAIRLRARRRAKLMADYLADPVELFRAAFGEPDDWQARAMRSRSPRLTLNVTRQGGKSSVTAAIGMHAALSEADALILMLSPSQRQSQELFRKVLDCYRAASRPVPAEAENRLALELANGSRIIALPGKEQTIRGFSGVRLLVIDEAARVEDALYKSVRPMLAVSGGRLVTLSTPFGKRGWWYEEWTGGGGDWERYEVPASGCPRITAEFLAEERRALGDLFFQSEYECRFVETLDAVFGYDDIQRMLDPDLEPLLPIGGMP